MARSTPPTRGASRPELRIHSAAAQTRTISAGTFCRSQWELSQYLKYMARSRSQLACDVRGDVAHPAVGGVEGHHAQGIQHQIHGAVPAVGKRKLCGAVGYGT